MKRRNKAVNTKNTKVQIAIVNIVGGNKETRVIIFDHIKKLCFKEMVNGGMKLPSFGEFETKPSKYNFIKSLLVTKFTKEEAELINNAISTAQAAELLTAEPKPQQIVQTIDVDSDIKREKECYDHAVKYANKLITAIESLETSGVLPKEYIDSRYPDLRADILNAATLLSDKWSEINTAIYKKSSIEERISVLQQQLCEANYQVYLTKEAYIIAMRNQISHLEYLDNVMAMIEEDFAEVERLKEIKELEEKLAALKSESKFVTPEAPSTPAPVVELEVELPTEKQDKEIRFLANHLYQVRRGNEDHNPTICRRIAELSAELKLTKSEFCKKILSVSVQCWNERHRKAFTDLGLHLYGERRHLTDTDNKKNYKDEIKRWASIHIIADDGNDVLNSDVYDKFVRDTGFSDIAKISFYNILARSLGYKPKCKYRSENGKTHCDTYYAGYRLI